LNDRFPNTLYHPNILYLVTSALPLYPEVIVRVAKRHGAYLVLNQNGVAYPGWHGPGWEKTNRTTRNLLRQADYVVYQSRFCKESADRFAGVCQAPWTILSNPVDTKIFVPASVPPPGVRILLAGSHQHWYRVRTALEALVHLPNSRLTIAGRFTFHPQESRCLEEVHDFAVHLGVIDRVELIGSYSQEAAPKLFQNHHILLHTKYNDPCPRLVVEAMACGLPVVYSASGGLPELVGEEGGIGCETPCDYERDHPPDPVALAQAVTTVAVALPRFAQQARLRAEYLFDVRPWLDRHEEIFSRLLAEETRPRRDK
jgi:glycosyltransferase involved in cell wall biosynthesis